jgi:hypothetical protein
MTFRLKADGATGKVAIYDYTAGNDNPFTDPTNNITRLKFHSDLDVVGVNTIVTGAIVLPAMSAGAFRSAATNVYAHGLGAIPYVEGRITNIGGAGVNLAFLGSVPVVDGTPAIGGDTLHPGYQRILHLGANSSYVIINEISRARGSWPAVSVSYELWITDQTL